MAMYAGQMNTRVELLESVDESGTTGQPVARMVSRMRPWAKVENLDARKIALFRQSGMRSSAMLTIRYSRRVVTGWQVKMEGITYTVESVAHDGRQWTMLAIFADGR